MHKSFKLMLALIIGLFTVPVMGSTVFAQSAGDIEDGTYDIGVTATEDGSGDVSVANDFVHDASLTIEGNSTSLTLGIGAGGGDYSDFDFSIDWVNVDGQKPSSSSDEGNLTYYTFSLNSLKSSIPAQMEYVVPDFPALADGHEVAFDLQLNLDNLPQNGSGGTNEDEGNGDNEGNDDGVSGENDNGGDDNGNHTSDNNDDNSNGTTENGSGNEEGTNDGEQEDNPQTGESSNLGLYSILLLVALIPLGIQVKRRLSSDR